MQTGHAPAITRFPITSTAQLPFKGNGSLTEKPVKRVGILCPIQQNNNKSIPISTVAAELLPIILLRYPWRIVRPICYRDRSTFCVRHMFFEQCIIFNFFFFEKGKKKRERKEMRRPKNNETIFNTSFLSFFFCFWVDGGGTEDCSHGSELLELYRIDFSFFFFENHYSF